MRIHRDLAGWGVFFIGGRSLAREAIPGFDVGRLWPIASVFLGAALLVGSMRLGRPAS